MEKTHPPLVRVARGSAARGVTLLEIMVTLSILGVIAALAVPGISAASRAARESEALGRVEHALQSARGMALRLNRCVAVDLVSSQTLRVREHSGTLPAGCDAPALGVAERLFRIPASLAALDLEVGGTDGDLSLVFLPEGGTPYAGPASLRVRTKVRKTLTTFEVLPKLGLVQRRSP